MCRFLDDEPHHLERRIATLPIEEDGERMHKDLAQQPAPQVLGVVRPHPFDRAARDELAKDGIDAVAQPAHQGRETRV